MMHNNHSSTIRFLQPILVVFVLVTLLSACEKDITLDLPDPTPRLVVEGYITPGAPAYIFLSRTAGIYDPLDTASLINYSVIDATVIISDGFMSDTLVQLSPSVGYLYLSPVMIGMVGRTYQLTVYTKEGDTATATTYIAPPVDLDSVWFKVGPDLDSLGYIWGRLTDPDTLGNRYRIFAKRFTKDKDFIAPNGSVSDDIFFNGLTFDFTYQRGKAPNSEAEDDQNIEEGYFKVGDTVVVKSACITKDSYEFWRAAEAQVANNGNPFGSISPLVTNITGGIGIWEGFSYTLDTLIAQ